MGWTEADLEVHYRNLTVPPIKANKYKVAAPDQRTVDDIRFDSKREAELYQKLRFLEASGNISELKRQVPFVLQEAFEKNGIKYRQIIYCADFTYEENGKLHVIDAKGCKLQLYVVKKKLFELRYPHLTIEEL